MNATLDEGFDTIFLKRQDKVANQLNGDFNLSNKLIEFHSKKTKYR